MSEPKFTKGPWYITEEDWEAKGDITVIYDNNGEEVLGIIGYIKINEPDLQLIADAWQLPDLRREIAELNAINKDMYEALEQMEPLINNSTGIVGYYMNGNIAKWNDFDVTRIIGNALRKARGETE